MNLLSNYLGNSPFFPFFLEEYMEETNQRHKVQIFATDLNNEVIQKARNGIYNSGIEVNVSPERLKRFFITEFYL